METFKSFEEVLYHVNERTFDEIALRLFQFQARQNPVYAEYIRHLGVDVASVKTINRIPYLPVSLFKTHSIKTGNWRPSITFTSSGTTGITTASHHVFDMDFYLENARRSFAHFYGDPTEYTFLAVLPSYAERAGSSLIAMIEDFIKMGGGGFYHQKPLEVLEKAQPLHRKTIIWGVTYALLDLAESTGADLSHCIVMETGGMKGKRKEITRTELHDYLTSKFHVKTIHSEYGMTELMSQAYSKGDGVFSCPPWMKLLLRDPEDPLDVNTRSSRGGINVIDLANIRSCAFIETQDLGKMGQNGSFEVLGRIDNSDIRGCNLLVE